MAPDIRVKDNVVKALDELGVPYELLPTQRAPEIIVPSNKWFIEVSHRGKTGIYELCQEMLPPMNFEDTIKYAIDARAKGEFSPCDSQFNFSAFKSVVDFESKQKDKIINFLRSHTYNSTFLSTTSLASYNYDGKGNDKFVHDAGMSEQYEIPVKIIGPDSEIHQADSSVLEAMVGEGVEEVIRVMREFNGTPTFIYRVNIPPKKSEKGVVRFFASLCRFYLDANGNSFCEAPSFGYKLVEQGK